MIIARWGRAPVVADIPSFITARDASTPKLACLVVRILLRKTTLSTFAEGPFNHEWTRIDANEGGRVWQKNEGQ